MPPRVRWALLRALDDVSLIGRSESEYRVDVAAAFGQLGERRSGGAAAIVSGS